MSLPLFTILYCYLIHLASSQWSFSHVCGPAGEIEYSVNIQQTTTYIDIVYYGTNRWVSLGFGKTTMYGAYAMVFGTGCERCSTVKAMDYWLTRHDDGDEIQECNGETCSQLISHSMSNGITIINASIDNDAGSTKTYKFDPTGSTPVEAMCAWGKDPTLEYDDEHCDGCWGTGTFTYSTKFTYPTKYPTGSSTKMSTDNPTYNPIKQPSKTPTNVPSNNPTQSATDYAFCLYNDDNANAEFITSNNKWSEVICEFCVCRDHTISDLICDIIDFDDIKRYDSYLIDKFMQTCQLDQECSFKQVGLKRPLEEITLCNCDLFQCNPQGNNANTFIFGLLIVLETIIVMFLLM